MATPALAEPGTPDQLPRGVAAVVNARNAQSRQMLAAQPQPEVQSPSPQPLPQALTQTPASTPTFRPGSGTSGLPPEIEKFLFAPTQRPNEPLTAGITASGSVQPPDDLLDWLPTLVRAAQMPGASPQVRAMAITFAHFLNGS